MRRVEGQCQVHRVSGRLYVRRETHVVFHVAGVRRIFGVLELAFKLGKKFFVLYGDSYLTTPFAPIADFFERSGQSGLMTVYRNQGLYDTSNVVFRDGQIAIYDKKIRLPEMQHIDYGLSMFRTSVFQSRPDGIAFDLADVMTQLVAQHDLAGFEVPERFYEIGSHAGLAELETLLRAK